MVALLEAMAGAGVDKIVFSSSAAVFGTPDVDLVTEDTPTRPESPYGESKLIGEWLLRDQARAAPLAHTSLRYFNVVGSGYPDLRDTSPHNLFPIVFDQLVAGKTPYINGDDYPTRDGTCVRDYIHVSDLAASHVTAAQGARRRAGTWSRSTTWAAAPACRCARSWTPSPGSPRSTSPRRSTRAGRAIRRRSWRPANWPSATWPGRCGTRVDQMVASAWEARQAAARRLTPPHHPPLFRRTLSSAVAPSCEGATSDERVRLEVSEAVVRQQRPAHSGRTRRGPRREVEKHGRHKRPADCHVLVTGSAFCATQTLQSSA